MIKTFSLLISLSLACIATAQSISMWGEFDLIQSWGTLKYLDPQLSSGKVDMDSLFLDKYYGSNHTLPEHIAINQLTLANKTWYTTDGCKQKSICFKNEKVYPISCLDSAGYRVLLIARFWNIIRFLSPDRYVNASHWDWVLENMLRREKDIKSAAAFDTLLLRLSAQTHDPHSTVFGGSLGWQGDKFLPPLSITWIDSSYYLSAIYDSTYSRYLGKSISAINERPIHDLIEVHKPYVAGQGQAYVNQHIATFYLLPGDSGSAFHVKLNDGGSLNTTRSLSFDTYRAWETQHKMQERTNGLNKDSILYINLGISITSTWLKEQFKTAKATILDLRQYPTWRNFKLLRYFLDKNTDSCVSVDPDVHYLLKDKSYSQALARKAKHPVPIYILISENTVSRSEYFAAILKTYNSTACLIGSPTVGAMGEFAQVPMYGDLSVSFTCGEVTFDGRSYFKQGLQPDITVHQQPSDIRGGIDRVLNTALDRARRMAH